MTAQTGTHDDRTTAVVDRTLVGRGLEIELAA